MKIGILGAMLEEVSSIRKLMVIEKESTIANRVFLEGKLGEADIVLTFSRWGKVASGSTTTTLINKFNVDFVIFTGVAGAVNESLNIGDVVISNGLYQHDMDARPFFDQFQIPLTSTLVFQPEESDIARAKHASELFLDKIDRVISDELLAKYSIFKPKVLAGLIASGDKFVGDPQEHENIKFSVKDNQTLSVEMEGAAVAQVCEDYKIPYIVVRTISDRADHCAAVNFQEFIKDIASTYSAEIVKEYLTLKLNGHPLEKVLKA